MDSDGSGKVTYTASNTEADNKDEWAKLDVYFEWEAGTDLGAAMVSTSYSPVSLRGIPRFAKGTSMTALTLRSCATSLRFPFLTNLHGYDTGIALTNASEADGSCMVSFSGMNAPTDDHPVTIPAGMSMTFGLGGEMGVANKFQGYAEAACDFLDAEGFAFISNGFGSMGGPTAAQGYLAVTVEAGGERTR